LLAGVAEIDNRKLIAKLKKAAAGLGRKPSADRFDILFVASSLLADSP